MKDKYKKENLEKTVFISFSVREICRNLKMTQTGRNTVTIKKYIKLHNISTDHFISKEQNLKNIHFNNTIPINEVLIENSNYYNSTGLKKKLLVNNLLIYKCAICGNSGVWNNNPISLQLDHINGVNNDNRLENLRFLCPNCHSQTETFCGKNLSMKTLKEKQKIINKGYTDKQLSAYYKNRKVERPLQEVLESNLKNGNFVSVGVLYNVSDNCIRKWCKYYNLSTKSKDYK